MLDLEVLNRLKQEWKFEFRQHNRTIASIDCTVHNNDQSVDVAERKQAQAHLCLDLAFLPSNRLVRGVLQNVCNHVCVRDHYSFLRGGSLSAFVQSRLASREGSYRQARRSAGVAQICRLAGTLTLGPFEGFKFRCLFAFTDEVVDGNESLLSPLLSRAFEDEDLVVWYLACPRRLERRLQKRQAREHHGGARGADLMFELRGRVGRTGRRHNAGQSVDGVGERHVVNLRRQGRGKAEDGKSSRRPSCFSVYTYGVYRVHDHNLVPWGSHIRLPSRSFRDGPGEKADALLDLGCRVRLPRETTGVGVMALAKRSAAIFLGIHELFKGD